MDYLKFICSWKGKIPNSKLSITINGIYLEGCLFDGHQLTDCHHDSPVVSSIPPFTAAWIPKVRKFSNYIYFLTANLSIRMTA